jgi:hypothetical protein
MAQLSTKIEIYLERKVDFLKEVILRDDGVGDGSYIWEWNVAETQPTQEQLDSLDAQATTQESFNRVNATRRTEYGSWNDQLDMQYWDQVNGTTTWKDAVAKIKADNPNS